MNVKMSFQAHQATYAKVNKHQDFVSLYYSAGVDQSVMPQGLIIYPKLGKSVPRPIFAWTGIVNALCFPLIFPFGESGYHPRTTYRCSPQLFEDRLLGITETYMQDEGRDLEQEWDSDHDQPPAPVAVTSAVDNTAAALLVY